MLCGVGPIIEATPLVWGDAGVEVGAHCRVGCLWSDLESFGGLFLIWALVTLLCIYFNHGIKY